MSINKSEEFVYFQNKAKHYQNIRNARPHIKDHLDKSYRNTINHSPTNRISYLQQYSIKVENENLINRLVNITKSKRTEVQAQGAYSRYNSNERSFRKKNPHRDQTIRRIEEQNQEMVSRITKTKPAIGSNNVWSSEYEQKKMIKRNMSRYMDSQKSKGSLHISTDRFIPQHYRSFIFKKDSLDSSANPTTIRVIPKQKLIALPRIIKNDRSQSVLDSNSHATLDI